MKLSSKNHRRILLLSGLAVFSVSPAWAVFPFSWVTDGSGTVTNGSWTGNGALQPNLNPASTAAQIAVQNFSSGGLLINNMGGNLFSSGRLVTNPISATHTITLTGGTADLRLHNSNSYDGGSALFNSVGLTDFQGVTEVSWTITFSEPIAGRNETLSDLTTRPMGAGLALITAGTGQGLSSFTVGMDYTQIYHEVGGEFQAGVPGIANPFESTATATSPTRTVGFNTAGAGVTSFTSDEFAALDRFLLVRGYDMDGVGGYSATDATKVYMRQMTWTIRKDDNTPFASDTLFTMSMDGQQYSANVDNVIPEPTSLMLVAGSVFGGCFLRRRRA